MRSVFGWAAYWEAGAWDITVTLPAGHSACWQRLTASFLMEAGMRVLRGYSENGKGLAVSCGRERVHAQYSAGRHDHACRCGTERSVSPWFDDHNHVCQRKNGVWRFAIHLLPRAPAADATRSGKGSGRIF